MSADRLLLTEEVAEILRVPESTLRDWRYRDVGPRSFKFRTRVVYRESELMAWIEEQESSTARGDADRRSA